MNHQEIPWASFLSRTSPSAAVNRLNSVLSQHFDNVEIIKKRRKTRVRAASVGTPSKTPKLGLFSRMFRADPIELVKTAVVEDHCLTLISIIGHRAPIKYNSDSERTEAQFSFLALISSLSQYSKSASFDARNSLGVGVHMPKSAHVALYETIIALLSRPEFDFRHVIHTAKPLKGSAAHVAGEYWRVLLTVLQLVLDLVFWAREEEMQFAANFFAMAIFRLPSVGGHVVDSLNQFHSRAAAHYRRLYPASTRSSELEYASRQEARSHSRSYSGGSPLVSISSLPIRATPTSSSSGETKEIPHETKTSTTSLSSSTASSASSASSTTSTTTATTATTATATTATAATATTATIACPTSPAPALPVSYASVPPEKLFRIGRRPSQRARSSSKQSFDFMNANPVIFGWLTFQSKVPGIDSGRVVELMKKRKREWNGRLRSSREFAMMLAAAVVDHVQDVVVEHDGIWWEEVPLYPVLADMVLLTLRRQFHLLVHPTDPSALDDYETRTALRGSSESFDYDKSKASALPGGSGSKRSGLDSNDRIMAMSDRHDRRSGSQDNTEEQEGNLIFSRPFFDTIVKTCSHFFSADQIMRNALLRMVCRHMDPERVSSVGPCLGAIELWLFRLHKVSPISMTKSMQLPCIRSVISSLLRSSRFVCTCRGLTFITTVVQHLSGTDDEALVWFLRDILFDHFFELMLSWSSFIRRFFHDFLVYRVFKLKRSFLDLPSDRRIFEVFRGDSSLDDEDYRVRAYDTAKNEFTTNRRRHKKKKKKKNRVGRRRSSHAAARATEYKEQLEGQHPDAATVSPSDMALATKMEAYMRILLSALNDPSTLDEKCCRNPEQRRGYIRVSLESFADILYQYYSDRKENSGYFEGPPPEMDISIDALMRRFAEGH